VKPWTEDILDQLSTAHLLAHADISCGERLAMIIVDNAVEYICKAYVEVYKNLIPSTIKKSKWDEIKKSFPQTLDFVTKQEPQLQSHFGTIIGFHNIRNDLYHGGKPLAVKVKTVDEYSKVARVALEILLKVKEDDKAQAKRISSIHSALLGEAGKEIKAGVTFEKVNDAVRFSSGVTVKLPDAICLVLHGFPIHKGVPPSLDQMRESLSHSGHATTKQILSVRLSELRSKKIVTKTELSLTGSGRTKLLKKYLSQ